MAAKNKQERIKVLSLFSGCGGLDLGFEKAGFSTVWANEFDKTIWATFETNFPKTVLDRRSITEISVDEIPNCDGMIGGPPCQSWSEAGAGRGINDKRGKLFFDYIRILRAKRPKFFLVENVSGILSNKHIAAFNGFLQSFSDAGYNVCWKLVNANDYNVPEDRERVIIVGYRKDLKKFFEFPKPCDKKLNLRDAIGDLTKAVPALEKNRANPNLSISNNEYMVGNWSPIFMSRNRVRSWNEPSFTIQAGGRQAPIHPDAPKMVKVDKDKFIFASGYEQKYRRLSVRECARIQTFPDNFKFIYSDVSVGYKMIGNAVPVNLAFAMAAKIREDLE